MYRHSHTEGLGTWSSPEHMCIDVVEAHCYAVDIGVQCAVDKGPHGQNVLHQLLLILLRICSWSVRSTYMHCLIHYAAILTDLISCTSSLMGCSRQMHVAVLYFMVTSEVEVQAAASKAACLHCISGSPLLISCMSVRCATELAVSMSKCLSHTHHLTVRLGLQYVFC